MAIEDYFKGSSQAYGQLAGSLLAGRKKEDKKEAKRALLASTIMATFGALQNQQKQNIIDGVNDVNTKYNEIFNLNKSEFEAYEDERALLKKYNDNKETFLNEEVAKIIDNTDEAVTARVKWADVDNQPDENLRKSMYAAYNAEREKLINRMESLKLDPRATTKTFEKFNQRAAEEYKAALALVEDDPTKKGLIKAAWNRIFKRQEDPERLKELQEAGIDVRGDLVTTNTELLDLQDALIQAKKNRTTFRDSIEKQIKVEKLYEPLVFKPKPKDLSEVYYSVIPNLKEVFVQNENYKNLDDKFYVEIINDVMEKNPSLNVQQIGQTAYMQLVQGDIDTEGYLTKEGIKIANGKALIDAFEETEDKDSFIKDNPFKLFQLMDAYDKEGDEKMSSGLAVMYKDILETNKDFKPTEQDKLNNIQRIRLKLKPNAKQYKSLLNDNDALATLGSNSAHALNYYKQNNPNWSNEYTEVELQEASIDFVLTNTFVHNSPNEIRMTKADTMGIKGFDVSLIDELPEIVEELTNNNVKKEKLQIVRDSFIVNINNPSLELEEDEILELTNKVNNAFKDTNLEEEESGQELIIPKPNITDIYKEKGVIKTHKGRKLAYLTNWEENVDELDLSKLSMDDLGYLATIKGNELYNYLGLDTNISLTPFRVQGLGYEGGIKSLHSKARQTMEQKLMNEENISRFKASGLVSGMFMNKDNNWNILKDDETINTIFENLKNNILS
jgi:hypothetical protein